MSTSIYNVEVELSKQLGDYWDSTTTGTGSTTSLVDTALMQQTGDWLDTDHTVCWDMITSGTYDEQERRITDLNTDQGYITTLAHGGAIASSVTYRIHRLGFSASDKRRAIVWAAKNRIHPALYERVRDESRVSGNWLIDGSFEKWTDSTTPTYWTDSTVTATQTTTSPYYKHGATSCKLDTAAGYIYQSISEWDDLKRLAGKAVTFTLQGWCDTDDALRIAIYDGTDTTYSSYHDSYAENSAWTEDNDPLTVTATIADNPTAIQFRIYLASATATAYVDDARVIGPVQPRIYIGDLSFVDNKPTQVLMEASNYSQHEPWQLLDGIVYDQESGYMYIPNIYPRDRRLRILGKSYLNFYDSDGAAGTDWDDTINVNSPQLEILVAEAAIYLCNQKIMPTSTTGETDMWKEARAYWMEELRIRKGKFAMESYGATVTTGV